jgi:hypothetical protein
VGGVSYGIRIVFGNRRLLTLLLLFGWLLMATMPFGGFPLSRIATPSTRMRMRGWLGILSCVPLIGRAADPPLWCVLLLWTVAGAGGVCQLAAAAAFVQALRPATRARAFGLAQSGLYAVQGLGILAQSPKTAAC